MKNTTIAILTFLITSPIHCMKRKSDHIPGLDSAKHIAQAYIGDGIATKRALKILKQESRTGVRINIGNYLLRTRLHTKHKKIKKYVIQGQELAQHARKIHQETPSVSNKKMYQTILGDLHTAHQEQLAYEQALFLNQAVALQHETQRVYEMPVTQDNSSSDSE